MSINIHKVPGCYICGFMGDFGTGKTLSLVEQGLKLAAKKGLRVVANFKCNQKYLKEYCKLKGYPIIFWHFQEIIENDYFSIVKLFSFKRAVIILDEAGLAMFSRGFKDSTRNAVFRELFQVRKNKSVILYSCQYLDQVDKQLRDNTQLWIITKGFQYNSKLYSRTQLALDRENFKRLVERPDLMTKIIYPIYLAKFRFTYELLFFGKVMGFLTHLFKAFKMGGQNANGKSIFYRLGYELEGIERYFKKLEYLSETDLLFKVYDSFEKVGDRTEAGRYKFITFDEPSWNTLDIEAEPVVSDTDWLSSLDSLKHSNGKANTPLW